MGFNPFNYLLTKDEIVDNYNENGLIQTCYLLNGDISELIPEPEVERTMTVLSIPNITQYFYGETLDLTGLIVIYVAGNIEIDITNAVTVEPSGVLDVTDTIATISYNDGRSTFTDTFPIVVLRKLLSIRIDLQPTTIDYYENDVFDPAGMIVSAQFAPNIIETITNYTWAPTILELTTTKITISYEENGITATTSQNVTVSERPAKTLNDYTWTEINEFSESGVAQNIFNVGDYKEFETTDGLSIRAIIIGFNHDMYIGGEKIGITFMYQYLYLSGIMNNSTSSLSTFITTYMYSYLNDVHFSSLPTELQSVIKPALKYTASNHNLSQIRSDSMLMWIVSATEANVNVGAYAMAGEGTPYQYFIDNGSTLTNSDNTVLAYWLRSPSNAAGYYCKTSITGTIQRASVSSDSPFATCFCI